MENPIYRVNKLYDETTEPQRFISFLTAMIAIMLLPPLISAGIMGILIGSRMWYFKECNRRRKEKDEEE